MSAPIALPVLQARLFGRDTPFAVGFEVTHRCNLACSYCDRHVAAPDEMSIEQIFEALDGLVTLGMRSISLDGGEALTHRQIGSIVDWLVERELTVRLNTNGILVPQHLATVRKCSKLKISLDGPAQLHDFVRGYRAYDRAMAGAKAALDAGVPVEFTCVVGRHNARALDAVLSAAESLGCGVIFQPARESLFVGDAGPAGSYMLDSSGIQAAMRTIETYKHAGRAVLNQWASLRHFRAFPANKSLPCAAGHLNATLDPRGRLYHCGQLHRPTDAPNVVLVGAEKAFAQLVRQGCNQCWCARVVEENYAWGLRLAAFLPTSQSSETGLAAQ